MNTATTQADHAACLALLAGGSRSFRAAARLLPARIAEPAAALYAFCRVADDAIDEAADPGAALPVLWARLDAMLAGRPHAHPADRAFAAVLREHGIPRALPAALLEGFAWDAAGRRYADLPALQDYAARVAATVGAMMTLLMGVRDPVALARACDLGVAMQLTNIARDVGEDARNGRLYLPLDWLRAEGLDPNAFLAAPRFTPALGRVVRRLLAAAEALYARAEQGIPLLPRDCRAGIGAARHVYAGIGRAVEQAGGDSVSRRAVVGRSRKLALMARGVTALALRPAAQPAPPLPATRFLVDAVAALPAVAPDRLADRIARAVALFDRLGEQGTLGYRTTTSR
ncbi:phytoene/squalene synthase family protein [Falsiroseomonas selenitidurans]|uniref:Phytoene/squalene synthase family protein n=1 Tax=Falsiroseomonas selenitidurans TaxID=2716335 RepID=A0ABX1E9V3_9PROT|nr:phytoene/squalene synthase family protein [Falsiroseomonas selenitidurans]NKC33977.1 phytoene/squalene synthase family protein [Falsiroseomonas selenitidurans]